jgi:MFS transporter, OPA family, sugar phosphate sensor protein UhpC
MALDISPIRVTGAVMGIIGIFSYLSTAVQDLISGFLIQGSKIMVEGKAVYNFDRAFIYWIGAAVVSLLLAVVFRLTKGRYSCVE